MSSAFLQDAARKAESRKAAADLKQSKIDEKQRNRDKARAALNGQGDRFDSDLFFKKLMVALIFK